MGRECSTNWEKRNAYGILMGKSEGKSSLERPGHRWVDNNNNGDSEGPFIRRQYKFRSRKKMVIFRPRVSA
jgi:hypothetical protein